MTLDSHIELRLVEHADILEQPNEVNILKSHILFCNDLSVYF